MSVEDNDQGGVDYTAQAKEMGWIPKEEFKGAEEKWVDAQEFVERAEHFLPLVRAQNGRLKSELLTRDKEISTLKQTLAEVQRVQKSMREQYDATVKKEVEQTKKDLVAQIKEARENGDTDLEFLLQDKLDDVRTAQREASKQDDGTSKATEATVDKSNWNPEFLSWNEENPWFGDMKDPDNRKRTKALVRIGEDLRDDGDTSSGRAFMAKCMAILEEREGTTSTSNTPKRTTSKVEGGNSGREARSSRGFDSLSKEAKDICHDDNDRFVGPGKQFKTVKEWEDYFYEQVKEG